MANGIGMIIPAGLIEVNENNRPTWNAILLSYLVTKYSSPAKKARLAKYLLTTVNFEMKPEETKYSDEIATIVRNMGRSRLGQRVGQNPYFVRWTKQLLRWFKHNIRLS
jgi:hypothetical protein